MIGFQRTSKDPADQAYHLAIISQFIGFCQWDIILINQHDHLLFIMLPQKLRQLPQTAEQGFVIHFFLQKLSKKHLIRVCQPAAFC